MPSLTHWLKLALACLALAAGVHPPATVRQVDPVSVVEGGRGRPPAAQVARSREAALVAGPEIWFAHGPAREVAKLGPAAPRSSRTPRFLLHRALLC